MMAGGRQMLEEQFKNMGNLNQCVYIYDNFSIVVVTRIVISHVSYLSGYAVILCY